MITSEIDLDANAAHLLMQRRAAPHLAVGFVAAVGALFELIGWHGARGADGAAQWWPPGAGSDDVRATLRAENGGAVDLRAGGLVERHADAWALFGRLVDLAACCGHGKIPEPTPATRRLAARALAGSAGVLDESLIEQFQADPEIVGPFFDDIATRVAKFTDEQ